MNWLLKRFKQCSWRA